MLVLLRALGIDDLPASGAHFEYSPHPEEGTSIDFVLPLASGGRVLFEVKYTEQDFGKAKADERHREKFKRIYYSRAVERFVPAYCEQSKFFEHYQRLRNIWNLRAECSDVVIFLVPRANQSLKSGLQALKSCTIESYTRRARVVFLEEFVCLLEAGSPQDMSEMLQQFRRKYLF